MPVVYNGVEGISQGDLFQGLKLWISHLVPLRSKWVDLVERNGGEVTKLATHADMKIADNIKKAGMLPPPGAYSYTWIDYSVRNGQLEDKEDYEIRAPQNSSRQIGSAQHMKSTRTKFTVKDDAILEKWVLARQWKGQATGGNEIYKELERQHPNHPWQSWRDRWINKLQYKPRSSTSLQSPKLELEQDLNDAETPTQAAATSSNRAKPGRQIPASQAKSPKPGPSNSERHEVQSSILPAEIQPPTRKKKFSKEEDQMLMTLVQEARDRGDPLNGNLMYQRFAEEHPNHPWQSWRDRWVKQLSLEDAGLDCKLQRSPAVEDLAQADRESMNRPPPTTQRHSTSSKSATGQPAGDASKIIPVEKAASAALSSASKPKPKSDDERLKRQEETRRRLRAVKTLQKTWRGYSTRRDWETLEAAIVPLQSIIRGYLARQNAASRRAESCNAEEQTADADLVVYSQCHEDDLVGFQDDASSSSVAMPQRDQDPRDYFYSDLQGYIEVEGADVDFEPSIGGLRIDLWDLYRIATKQDCEPEHRDMETVAEELGLDWRKFPGTLDELQECYHQNLAGFEEAIKDFDNERLESDRMSDNAEHTDDILGEDLPETLDVVVATKEALVEYSSPGYRSSPPVAGSKRSYRHDEILSSDPGYPSAGSRKRRRLDKSSIIPPTPEANLGYCKGPSQRSSNQNYTSPLKPRGDNSDFPIEMSSDEESRMATNEGWDASDIQNDLPRHSKKPEQKHVEPETQDWGFAHAPQARPQGSDLYGSVELDDFNPSQQLEMEFNEHNVPDRNVPGKLAVPPSASSDQKTGEGLAGEPRRLIRQRTAAQQSSTTRSRSAIETRAKKRVLPMDDRQDTAPKAGAQEAAPLLGKTSKPKPLPQLQITTPPKASGILPVALAPMPRAKKRTMPTSQWQDTVHKAGMRRNSPLVKPASKLPQSSQPHMPTSSKALANVSVPAPRGTQRLNETVSGLATHPTPSIPSSPHFSKEKYDDAYVQAQVDHFGALGYHPSHIATAMLAATFQRGPQTVALESLNKGLGLPQNERGIWTEEDIRDLGIIRQYEKNTLTGTSKVDVWNLRNRLLEKHGEKGFGLRQELENETDQGSKRKRKARAG